MSYFQGSNRHWINYREFRGITGTPYAAVQCDRVPSSLQADGAGAASTTTVHVSGCTQRALLKLSARQRGSCLDGLCSLASSRGGEDTKTYSSPTPAFGRSLNTGTTCPFRCRVSQKMPTVLRWLLVMSRMFSTVSLQTAGYSLSLQVRKLMEGL